MLRLASATAAVAFAAAAPQQGGELFFKVGDVKIFGSGCPEGTVEVSGDGVSTISVDFSEFAAKTSPEQLVQYKSCNVFYQLEAAPGYKVLVAHASYRGRANVPKHTDSYAADSYAAISAAYFFAEHNGPSVSQSYTAGFHGNISNSVTVKLDTWTPCGGSYDVFMIANLAASKAAAQNGDVEIALEKNGFDFNVKFERC